MRSCLPLAVTDEVRDRCLCLHLQRAAARLFDEALRPHSLTNGQFSLLMAVNCPCPPRITDLVPFLAIEALPAWRATTCSTARWRPTG